MRGKPKGDLKKILASAAKKDLMIGAIGDIAQETKAYSTGNIAIDAILGVGGLPQGRSVELYGPPSCGKTTTALQAAALLQQTIKAGGNPELGVSGDDMILYLDYEHALDPDYAKALGLDVEDKNTILFAQPDTLEDGANYAIELIETGLVRMVIFDSVASMQPSAKAEAEIGKSLPAVQAKLIGDLTVKLNPILQAYDCTALFLNHEREVMSMGGGRPGMPPRKSTPGGISLKYYASVRIRYVKVKDNKETIVDPLTKIESDITTSSEVLVKVEKNKVGPPFRQAQVRVRFGRGFDNFFTAMQILVAHKKVITGGSGYFYFHNVEDIGLAPEWMSRAATGTHRPFVQGQPALFKAADNDKVWRAGIIALAEQISEQLGDEAALAIPELEEEFEATP
jgi:recombination protein RecA